MLKIPFEVVLCRVHSKIRYLPSVGGFRDSFYYNDLMYGLAAHITESLEHQKWEQQVQSSRMLYVCLSVCLSVYLSVCISLSLA